MLDREARIDAHPLGQACVLAGLEGLEHHSQARPLEDGVGGERQQGTTDVGGPRPRLALACEPGKERRHVAGDRAGAPLLSQSADMPEKRQEHVVVVLGGPAN